MPAELRKHVLAASVRPEVVAAVRDLYHQLEHEIDRLRPTCLRSGRCCRFDEFGHRLYVTTIELAAFVHDLSAAGETASGALAAWDGATCPFQNGNLCSVHVFRPFGCRVFFCDPQAADSQKQLYERFHAQLKQLHAAVAVPYLYTEWRQAIRAVFGD